MFGACVLNMPKTESSSNKEATFRHADMIAQHYRRSLADIMARHPDATNVIVLEEDLVVSPNILDYFAQVRCMVVVAVSFLCLDVKVNVIRLHADGTPVGKRPDVDGGERVE